MFLLLIIAMPLSSWLSFHARCTTKMVRVDRYLYVYVQFSDSSFFQLFGTQWYGVEMVYLAFLQ